MILGKLWNAIAAQFNKLANCVQRLRSDRPDAVRVRPIGRADCGKAARGWPSIAPWSSGSPGRWTTSASRSPPSKPRSRPISRRGDRDTAAKFALDLKRAKDDLAENEKQLALHEQAYNNNLLKIKHAVQKLEDVKHKITKYDADLKMSRAEAEMSQLATQFNFNVTTDFGQAEQMLQDQIDRNRGRVRVAADLSGEGVEDVKREIAVEKTMGEDALKEFEKEMGLATPAAAQSTKQLGPATKSLEALPEI